MAFLILLTIYYYKNKKVNFIIIMAKLPNGFKCDKEQKQLVPTELGKIVNKL